MMSDAKACPECGGPLRDDILDGLCPRCVARVALTSPSGEDSRVAPEAASEGTVPIPPSPSLPRRVRYVGDHEPLEEFAHGDSAWERVRRWA